MMTLRTLVASLLAVGLALSLIAPTAAADVVGWRTDWTGKYPDADPPTRWSATENVLWKTPMPSWSNATPVLVGDRIFVCAEPTTLLCVDAKTGAILWQKTNSYLDTMPLAEAARLKKLADEIDVEKRSRELTQARQQVSRFTSQLKKKPNDAALRKQKADAEQRAATLKATLKPVEVLLKPSTQGVNGYSSCTPVSDGKSVFALFGTGVVACYDLDGNRKWITMTEKTKQGYGHSASPLLVDGKLIVHINSLIALDPANGKQLWRSGARSNFGTPAPARIGQDPVIITASGDFFRAADGQKVADRTCRLNYNQPIVENGVVYFVQHKGRAFRLPAAVGQKPERMWETQPKSDRYYASPVIHDGLIYAITQFGILSAIDAKTGRVVYEQKLDLGRRQQVYPSLALAGKYLYVSGSSGVTVVVQPGRGFKEVARNTLEPFRSSPVFRGKRLYVRGLKHLYCIGR